jgi:hypothetical protein
MRACACVARQLTRIRSVGIFCRLAEAEANASGVGDGFGAVDARVPQRSRLHRARWSWLPLPGLTSRSSITGCKHVVIRSERVQ